MAITAETIELLVVYKDPSDYPGKFVVRRWRNQVPDSEPLMVCDSLEHARMAIPRDAGFLGRYEQDDPAILEVWL